MGTRSCARPVFLASIFTWQGTRSSPLLLSPRISLLNRTGRQLSHHRSCSSMTSLKIRHVTDSLEKPALDDRSYRVIELPNKLEALLAHDPNTDKASASVNVNVGSYSDADDMPGMAHAVEHLLFMGTKKVTRVESVVNANHMLMHLSIRKKMLTTSISPLTRAIRTHTRLRPRPTISLRLQHRLVEVTKRTSQSQPCMAL